MYCAPRKAVANLKAAVHGGTQDESILDFSVGVNPFPPPAEVTEAFRSADISRYPDSGAHELKRFVAHTYGVGERNILAANGTSQAFWLITLTYLEAGERVLLFSPGYGDYSTASRIMGAEICEYRLSGERDFLPDGDDLDAAIERIRPKIVWLCNPSNPTGAYMEEDAVRRVLRSVSSYGGILVLDEAYIYFVRNGWNSLSLIEDGNLIVGRSMTKDFGFPGLRLGYIAAAERIISQIAPVQPPWSVNTAAQQAGIAALRQLPYYENEWMKVGVLTDRLVSGLRQLGFYVVPTRSNFILFKTGSDLRLAERLAERGIIVRDCTSFGLPGYIRVGTRLEGENERLLATIEGIVKRRQ